MPEICSKISFFWPNVTKRGGGGWGVGAAMSEVLSKISYKYKFVYFICSHDREVHIGEQNNQNKNNQQVVRWILSLTFIFHF